jgi:cation:H+ antiporter
MTTPPILAPSHRRAWLQVLVAVLIALPGPVLRLLIVTDLPHPELASPVEALIFGISIFAAATLLIWATEVAERLVSAALALAVLAIIAVLPEYAVDLFFAWTAPDNPENAHFALANMTGANRLLIGLAWPAVFLVFWLRTRKHDLAVGKENSIALLFLAAATIYSFTLPIRGHLSLIDSAVLISIFLIYLYISSRMPPHRGEELVGPAAAIEALPIRLRWAVIIALFVLAAGVVFASAEPFAESLIHTGETLGIEEFLLVQWVAPLASEAPEFLLAAFLALRGRADAGMTLLLSSKVNQWTLLVGSLPVAYSISGVTLDPLPMDARQAEEVFLTAGQSIFAVAVLVSLSYNALEAALIFILFSTQLVIPMTEVRLGFGAAYIVLALIWFLVERREIPVLVRSARTTLSLASASDPPAPAERDKG